MDNRKSRIITVQDIPIAISASNADDYSCITDIANAKSDHSRAADVVRNWLRNRGTLEFLATWKVYIIQILKCSNLNTLKSKQDY